MRKGKIIVVAAPSGCGKSTIINALMDEGNLNLGFAVSATTRPPRDGERDGVNYYFMTEDAFRDAIAEGEFVEYEEVYPGRFYGTLKREIDRITESGCNIILDLDVNGALRVKELYGEEVMTLFIQPPSIDALRQRLEHRATETPESIDARLDRAAYEISQAPRFDVCVINDDLADAIADARRLMEGFIALR